MTTKLPQVPAVTKAPAKLLRRPVPGRQFRAAYPTIEDITRRQFLIGAAGLLVLAPYGCGGESRETAAGAIRVEHAAGVTEVPRDVGRIAAIDGWPDLHSLLALGVVPEIAAIDYQKESPVVQGRVDEVEATVEPGDPNLESLAAADPGLILGAEYNEEIYDELSEIAPTVLLDRYESDVNEHLRTVARSLGRPSAAQEVILEHEDRLDAVAASVEGSRLATMPVAVVVNHPTPEGTFRLLGPSSYSGRTMEQVGVTGLIAAPEGEPDGPNGEFGTDVSTELMAEVLGPAELILFATSPVFEGTTPWTEESLWNGLPAVQSGAVAEVYLDTWYFDTALTRTARLDDVEELTRRPG